MGLTVHQIQARLAQFQFEALFLDDLGWRRPQSEALLTGLPGMGRVLAIRGNATAIAITGGQATGFTLEARHAALDHLAQTYPDPLVIWQDAAAQRSLWCWRGNPVDVQPAHWRSHSVVVGYGSPAWAGQLRRLQGEGGGDRPLYQALNSLEVTPTPDQGQGFSHSWRSLTTALEAIPQGAERSHYGTVLLARLISLVALQRRGWLGGDEWYLHNLFGQSQQRGADRFFQEVFQPLCYQGLGLPTEERSQAVHRRFGSLPFLPTGPFALRGMDRRWGQLALEDRAFEPALTWLGDLALGGDVDLGYTLSPILELAINDHGGLALVTPEPIARALVDRTLSATLLDWAEPLMTQRPDSIDSLLLTLPPQAAGALLHQLEHITLLDPACGSGRYLRWALAWLMEVTQLLRAIARLDQTVALPPWVQTSPLGVGALYRHFASHSLYGLDSWSPAVELARLALWLHGLEHSQRPQDLASLPDLSLTVLQGNGLMGLVRVDPERFDQIASRGRRSPGSEAPDDSPLQGNLLQPLMADTYQSILAERQVRLEHYRSQTQLLAEVGTVPVYAQTDFLRDRLEDLNRIAQGKLTHLLWSEGSQQLSLRVTDAAGIRQTRPLAIADVAAVEPFHWGFYFHQLLTDGGGFDILLSHFPGGAVQPTAHGFIEAYQDLFQAKAVAPSTFLHNHKQLLKIDPDLATAWDHYRGQFALPGQYFRRSGQYPCAEQSSGRLYWSRLFLERGLQLLRPGGRCGVMLDPFWAQGNSAPLRHWLEANTDLEAVVELSNHQGLWPSLPARTTVCLLWLRRQGPTGDCPYSAYHRAANALAPEALGAMLQRLIDLAEETR
jgi:hypothetical protein